MSSLENVAGRLPRALQELQQITDILGLMTGNARTPLASSVAWLIPKLDAVARELDTIDTAMMDETAEQGDASHV